MLIVLGGFSHICLAELSWFANVTCGIPRGYILGPLLFLIYVNDIAGAINEEILLCADDTTILVSDKHVDAIKARFETAFETISSWLIDNKLSLHLGKTQSNQSGRNENPQTIEI